MPRPQRPQHAPMQMNVTERMLKKWLNFDVENEELFELLSILHSLYLKV